MLAGDREDGRGEVATSLLEWDLERDDAWRTIETAGLPVGTRFMFAAHDSLTDRVYAFLRQDEDRGALWSLTLGATPTWSRIEVENPPHRESRLLVDSNRHWLLALGDSLGSLRALDLGAPTRWNLLSAGQVGSGIVAFDAARDRLISASIGSSPGDDCVVREYPMPYGPGRQLSWYGSPPTAGGLGYGSAYDVHGDRILVYSHFNPIANQPMQMLELKLRTPLIWSSLSPQGPRPVPRQYLQAAVDRARNRLLFFGGSGAWSGDEHLDVDELTLGPSPRFESLRPRSREHAAGAVDPTTGRVWLHGGLLVHANGVDTFGFEIMKDVVTTDLEKPDRWVREEIEGGPGPRYGHCAVFDPSSRSALFFGGRDSTHAARSDTWRLGVDGSASWELVPVEGTPPTPRAGAATVWVPGRQWMVLYGGGSSGSPGLLTPPLVDTWILDFTLAPPRWREVETNGSGPLLEGRATFAWDPRGNRAILHGTAGQRRAATWALRCDVDPPRWEPLVAPDPPGGPLGRNAVTAYDPVRHRLVATLGTVADGFTWSAVDTTWVLPLAHGGQWRVLATSGRSAAHVGALPFMDTERDRMLVVGGRFDTTVIYGDTVYHPFGYPSPVYGLAFDPASSTLDLPRSPVSVRLAGAHPARGSLGVRWTVPDDRSAEIELFDLRGRRIRRLRTATEDLGSAVLVRSEDRLPAGVYFVRVTHPGGTGTMRVVYLGI